MGLSFKSKETKVYGHILTEKLGSKRATKDILVNKYNFDEETARFAAGYKWYENWQNKYT